MTRIGSSFKKAYDLCRKEGLAEFVKRTAYYKISIGYLQQLKIFAMNESYVDAYRQWINYKIRGSGADAIGGYDSEIGDLQFEFLKTHGLSPDDNMLDIGCGALRGGKRFMKYLNSGNYTGIDINENIIERKRNLTTNF